MSEAEGAWPHALKEMDSAQLVFALHDEAAQLLDADSVGRLDSAARAAADLHAGQTRANRADLPRTPYIEHPLRNAVRLMRWGVDDAETLTAAVLHDVPEDCSERAVATIASGTPTNLSATERTHRWIADAYGQRVSDAVRAVTNPPRREGMTRAARNAQYANHVREAVKDPRAFLVKASDFADNAGSLQHNVGEVGDEFIARRVAKYAPVADILTAAAREHADRGTIPGEVGKQVAEMVSRAQTQWTDLAEKGRSAGKREGQPVDQQPSRGGPGLPPRSLSSQVEAARNASAATESRAPHVDPPRPTMDNPPRGIHLR